MGTFRVGVITDSMFDFRNYKDSNNYCIAINGLKDYLGRDFDKIVVLNLEFIGNKLKEDLEYIKSHYQGEILLIEQLYTI